MRDFSLLIVLAVLSTITGGTDVKTSPTGTLEGADDAPARATEGRSWKATGTQLRVREMRKQPCDNVYPMMYMCDVPEYNEETQQPKTCAPDNSMTVTCYLASGHFCEGNKTVFEKRVPDACRFDAHIHHPTALLFSVFLGLLGIDRFYLGYYTIGVIKLFSLGGMCVLFLVDIVLIALQSLGPADGSTYIITTFGPWALPQRFDAYTNITEYSCPECA